VGGDNLAQRLAAADVDQDVGDALMAQLARNSAYYTPRPNGTVDGGSPTHSRSRAQLGDAEGGWGKQTVFGMLRRGHVAPHLGDLNRT
jgi:hypothetical protein